MSSKRIFMLVFLIGWLVSCARVETAVSTPSPSTAEPTALPTAVPATSPSPPLPSPSAAPFPSPTSSPTPAPISLGNSPAVTGELAADFEELSNSNPAFAWRSPADVELTVNGDLPIANWVYAVAAPFPTLQDEISLADLQTLWQTGGLVLAAETEAVLRAWWGEPQTAATIIPSSELVDTLWARQTDQATLTILPFHRLEPRLKVLRVDGVAPIDMNFDPATYALTIQFGLSGPQAAVVQAAWNGPTTNWQDGRITHIVMTGPAGMRRAVADRMERYGLHYPAEETGPILQTADIAHMSNEDPFATDCPPADPYNSEKGCNRAEYFELMTWMGIDVNEMTGNHLNDWGTAALQYTFDLYEESGIRWFGGGRDLADAARPLLIEHHGNKIAFIGCNPVGPAYDWATADRPGALPCGDYANIQSQIRQLADEGYLVIATLQYLEDYQYTVLAEQQQAFQGLAEAGATAVSGSHGHHPQGFSFHGGAFIHYGLGNLLADQMWSLGSRQTFLDVYTVLDGRLLNVDLWTGLNEDYARIRQMTPEERQALLQAVFAASDW